MTFYFDGDPRATKSTFDSAGIVVTVRDKLKQVRASPALFNTDEEVGLFLEGQGEAGPAAHRGHYVKSFGALQGCAIMRPS